MHEPLLASRRRDADPGACQGHGTAASIRSPWREQLTWFDFERDVGESHEKEPLPCLPTTSD
jgi:hypothetical protein